VVSFADPPLKRQICAAMIDTGWVKYPCNRIARPGSNYCGSCRSEPHPEPESFSPPSLREGVVPQRRPRTLSLLEYVPRVPRLTGAISQTCLGCKWPGLCVSDAVCWDAERTAREEKQRNTRRAERGAA
jgi:hypothetical protein